MSQHNYLDNKYTRWYFSIINNAKQRATPEGYTENHHIVPLCLGGDNSRHHGEKCKFKP